MPSRDTCRRGIELLHEFFVDWYTGQVERNAFDRLERALASEFEMVTPEGVRRGYDDVVGGIKGDYATHDHGDFVIEIRNVETRLTVDEHALVRYEEWQETPDGTTGRVSTALLQADSDTPAGIVWLDLQETWLEAPNW